MDSQQLRTTWVNEAEFFDREAERHTVEPINRLTLARYSAARPRRRFKEEFRFRILGDLRGKRVLDVGCGDGRNAVLLAKLGARVTGIDISPGAIRFAQDRAKANDVADSVNFICSPLEEANIPDGSFDVIWGDCILHHLLATLEDVLQRLSTWAKPGATMLFSEPVNFNNTLRRLRLKIPIVTEATPDERPLEPCEIRLVNQFLPDMSLRFYSLFTRVDRFLLPGFNYERASLPRRATFNALAMIDYGLLSLPLIQNMGGYAIVHGHSRQIARSALR
jgi:2-polyprenyl-3-methyl-5-hydroxy-6-metoxy-1,4-benzoquinol methylase